MLVYWDDRENTTWLDPASRPDEPVNRFGELITVIESSSSYSGFTTLAVVATDEQRIELVRLGILTHKAVL